jgi:hypothetical protein
MATITIEIPDGATRKEKIAALEKALEPINAQREAILAQIKAIRAACPHENAYRGRDISGGPDGRCYDCGYSW